jgi:hypothetical protein
MTHELRGTGLYDSRKRLIATTRGQDIFDGNNRRVATMRGNELFDSNYLKMMSIDGPDILDAGKKKVALLADVQKWMRGAESGMLSAAFWYCFVR